MVPPQERRKRQVFCGKDDPGGRGREVVLPDRPHPPRQVRDEGCRPWAQRWCRQRYAWKQSMTNLVSVLKSRDITLLTKVHIVKAMVFPVVMYGCESWTIKKIEHQRTDASNWNWKRLLRVPWTAKRSNWSILKEINPEY